MSTQALSGPPAPSTEPSYFAQVSTRWDVFKFLVPTAVALAWWLVTLYFNQQAQARDIAVAQQQIAHFQQVREERISELALLHAEADQRTKDIGEIKQDLRDERNDIKLLLQRVH